MDWLPSELAPRGIHTAAQLIFPSTDTSTETSGIGAVLADAAPTNYTSLQVPHFSDRTIVEHVGSLSSTRPDSQSGR